MARGAARVMGFRLTLNFDRPYAATSLSDFWRRWHITLSTWLRDYVYEPVAMARRDKGIYGVVLALMLTFLISGLWHGANWTFVVWGLLHGLGLSLEAVFAKKRKKLAKAMPTWLFNGIMLTATFSFVNFTYIFFRAKTMEDAVLILEHVGHWIFPINRLLSTNIHSLAGHVSAVTSKGSVLGGCALIVFLVIAHSLHARLDFEERLRRCAWWIRWPMYQVALLCIAFGGVWLGARSFVYFQF
jgi:alginate O-acetyltransferase complex protein AlgI